MVETLFDFDEARRIIKEGAKAFFTRVRAEFPDEVFYVYVAVGTDDDPKIVHFNTNSEQGFEKSASKYRANKARVKSDQERGFRHQVFYYKWAHVEWKYQGGDTDVAPFYDLIQTTEEEHDDGESDHPGPEVDVDIRAQSYAAAVLGLRQLDAEGFFGIGSERDQVTLFFTILDSEEDSWIVKESARLLNPPEVYERFYAEWLPPMTTEAELANSREHPSSVRKAFSAIIAHHS